VRAKPLHKKVPYAGCFLSTEGKRACVEGFQPIGKRGGKCGWLWALRFLTPSFSKKDGNTTQKGNTLSQEKSILPTDT